MLGYIQDFWMGSIGCGYCQYLQVWKPWVVSSVGEVLPKFFLTIEFNYVIIRIKLCRTKSTSRRLHRIAASSSSSEDDMSLGSHQEEAFAPSTNAASSSAEARCLHSGINSPAIRGTVEGRPFNVSLFRF
jgi:hypothetical protein